MTAPNYPNSTLVAIEWLKGVPGLRSGGVASILPSDNTTWGASGFVTVDVVGGTPDAYLPVGRPVLQIDTWAVRPGTGRPPWGVANNLSSAIIRATRAETTLRRVLTLPEGYPQARLLECFPITEPRRLWGDDASYARYQFDMFMHWTLVEASDV